MISTDGSGSNAEPGSGAAPVRNPPPTPATAASPPGTPLTTTPTPTPPAGSGGGAPPPPPASAPPLPLTSAPPLPPTTLWEQVERWSLYAVAASLAFTLVIPLALLVTERLHRVAHADEKMVALGLGVLFASITLMFLTRFIRSLEGGESLGVESHWGGLGGGVGGWRVSRPVGYLFCVMTFGALTAVAVSRYPGGAPALPSGSQNAPTQQQAAQTSTQEKAAGTKPETKPQTPAPGATTGGGSGAASETKGP